MLDRSVFPGRVHGLKNQQQAPTVLRRKNVLQPAHFFDAVRQQFLRLRLQFGPQPVRVRRVVILEAEVFPVFDAVALEQFVDFHSVTCCNSPRCSVPQVRGVSPHHLSIGRWFPPRVIQVTASRPPFPLQYG